jgi:hypothetical protein
VVSVEHGRNNDTCAGVEFRKRITGSSDRKVLSDDFGLSSFEPRTDTKPTIFSDIKNGDFRLAVEKKVEAKVLVT